jgi:hypothetical protein
MLPPPQLPIPTISDNTRQVDPVPTGSFAVNHAFTVNSHVQLSLLTKIMVLLNLLHLECEIPSFVFSLLSTA